MEPIKIFDAEYKFMNIIWEHSPITSPDLVKLANKELGWKKSTTYTVIRRLSKRGAIENINAVVSALVSKEDVMFTESREHISKIYEGSMQLFFTTFLKRENLTDTELAQLKAIIDEQSTKGEVK